MLAGFSKSRANHARRASTIMGSVGTWSAFPPGITISIEKGNASQTRIQATLGWR